MRIIYINRSTKGFSIEKVFSLIKPNFKNGIEVVDWFAPSSRDKPIAVLQNFLYFISRQFFYSSRTDIFHITGVLHYLFFALPRNRTVLTIHDCVKVHQQKGIKKLITKWLWFKLPVSYFKYITVVSNQTKRELIELTGCAADKISVIYNPVDPDIVVSKKKFNPIKPVVLHIGTGSNKNVPNLLQSLKNISCKLIIVGNLTKHHKKLLLEYNMDFENFTNCSDEMIRELYGKSDIVSFITTYEGFGMPIVEGQSAGKVVITSNLEPHIEVSNGTAIYANPYSLQSIKKSFDKVIKEPNLRQNLIESGLKNVGRFKSREIAAQYLIVYNNIHMSL